MLDLKTINARISQGTDDIAGAKTRHYYGLARVGDLHRNAKQHLALFFEVVESADPDYKVGTVDGFALCDGRREASLIKNADTDELTCEKCGDAIKKILAKLRRDARRKAA